MLPTAPPLSRLEFSVACRRAIAREQAVARSRGIAWPESYCPSIVAEVVPELARPSRPDQKEFLFRQIQAGHTRRLAGETAGLLRWLRQRQCLLGIGSNAQACTLRELREAVAAHGLGLDLLGRDLCFWSFEHGFSKPDPHVFRILTARLEARGLRLSETWMVGGRLDNDIEPAKVHGWQTWPLGPAADGDWTGLRETLHGPQSKAAP